MVTTLAVITATVVGVMVGLAFLALRLAVRHQLAWHELDALRAHALLDQAEGSDHGWSAKADALHARLVPPGLDPDPLGTVERLVAEQKAAEAAKENEG